MTLRRRGRKSIAKIRVGRYQCFGQFFLDLATVIEYLITNENDLHTPRIESACRTRLHRNDLANAHGSAFRWCVRRDAQGQIPAPRPPRRPAWQADGQLDIQTIRVCYRHPRLQSVTPSNSSTYKSALRVCVSP